MIKNAIFTSVWNGNEFEVETSCKVNMDTREVFDIEVSDADADMLHTLDCEYVTIDGIEYDVVPQDEFDDYDEDDEMFWYEQ